MQKENIIINSIEALFMDNRYYLIDEEKRQPIGIRVTFAYNKKPFITRFDKTEFKDPSKVSHEEIKDKIIEVLQ